MTNRFLVLAGVFGFLGVATGAFGEHGLSEHLDEKALRTFGIGSRYVLVHAVALLGVAIAGEFRPSTALTVSGWSFVVGMVVFGGSLWALALTGVKWLGAITPIGGVAFLVGWLALVVAGMRG